LTKDASDSIGALARVRCPVMIVQAVKPWLGGHPYFPRRIVEAQLNAVPGTDPFVAEQSDHGTIIRDPAPDMVAAILRFVGRCAGAGRAAPWPSSGHTR
jgi:hypothetical protein